MKCILLSLILIRLKFLRQFWQKYLQSIKKEYYGISVLFSKISVHSDFRCELTTVLGKLHNMEVSSLLRIANVTE
jgi:hypothetical protein